MIVRVIPKRPIPGILPKNKWIDTEMILDLNKAEISYCMQYGTVRDERSNLIDDISVKSIPTSIISSKVEPKKVVIKEETPITTVYSEDKPIIIDMSKEPIPEVAFINESEEEIIEEETVIEDIPYYNLKIVSLAKEDDYIILETELDTNSKLEGNLYGLFTVSSGPRPVSVEFEVGEEWFKFGSKFANFTSIENGAKYTFRIVPKSENEITFRIVIKEANNELVKLEEKINPVTIL